VQQSDGDLRSLSHDRAGHHGVIVSKNAGMKTLTPVQEVRAARPLAAPLININDIVD
jgi:hypothetical protein